MAAATICDGARAMYDALQALPGGCSYLSVGHRPSLLEFHDHKLRLKADGNGHEFQSITDYDGAEEGGSGPPRGASGGKSALQQEEEVAGRTGTPTRLY